MGALLAQVIIDLAELQAINDVVDAQSASQPRANGAEEARVSFWHQLCHDLRTAVHVICLRAAATPAGQDALQQLSWVELTCTNQQDLAPTRMQSFTWGGGGAAQAIGRRVPVSSRYVERQRQRLTSLRSCGAAA